MAVEAINRNETLLKDYELFLLEEDGACSADHVMKAFIKYVHSVEFPRIIGILGRYRVFIPIKNEERIIFELGKYTVLFRSCVF